MKMPHRNHGRAQTAPASQCFDAWMAIPTLPTKPTAEMAVSIWLCGSDARAIGANTIAALPKKNGIAQQVAKANAEPAPAATSATALVDLILSFMVQLKPVAEKDAIPMSAFHPKQMSAQHQQPKKSLSYATKLVHSQDSS